MHRWENPYTNASAKLSDNSMTQKYEREDEWLPAFLKRDENNKLPASPSNSLPAKSLEWLPPWGSKT